MCNDNYYFGTNGVVRFENCRDRDADFFCLNADRLRVRDTNRVMPGNLPFTTHLLSCNLFKYRNCPVLHGHIITGEHLHY